MKTAYFDETLHYERALIGAILAFPEAFFLALQAGLQRNEIPTIRLRHVFDCARHLHECSLPIELPSVCAELAGRGLLGAVGGEAYLSELIDGVPSSASVAAYVAKLKDAATRNRVEGILQEGMCQVVSPSTSIAAFGELGHQLITIASGRQVSAPEFSEEKLALRFSELYADRLRYVHRWGRWLIWNGSRWIVDDTQHALDMVRDHCRSTSMMCKETEKSKATRLASKSTVSNVLQLASSDRRVAATTEQWDGDLWSLNTPLGTVDLRTGAVREHRREDYITKSTLAGPGGDCPVWLAFLDRVTGGDVHLQSFLQRLAGYALTGSTSEQALFFLYGTGANGKSVFLSTLAGLLGDYAKTTPSSSFTVNASEQHPTDIARLQGVRLVTAVEVEDGARWAESRLKALTGGDRIAARFMRCDFFEFLPQFKLFIAANHKPGLRSVDEAMKRRIVLVPFTVTIPKDLRDPKLPVRLQSEYPGILAWAIRGYLEWQKQGLNPPPIVRDATEDYLSGEDLFGRWIEDRVVVTAGAWAPNALLYSNYRQYCLSEGEEACSRKRFAQQLDTRGFRRERRSSARGTRGLMLRDRQ